MKKIIALLLCGVLGVSVTAAAAGAGEVFPAVNSYAGYADVAEGDWFADAARVCYEVGLMTGTDSGFAPYQTLTVGEVAAIAARMSEALTGEAVVMVTPKPGETLPWYTSYVNFLEGLGVTVPDGAADATRQDFLKLLAAILPEDRLEAINSITSLPDSDDADVLAFYNAGILTGVDEYGTFAAGNTLTRAECAAMVARVARPELRKEFTPAEKPQVDTSTLAGYALGLDGSVTAFTADETAFDLETYCRYLFLSVYNMDLSLYNYYDQRLDWTDDYGVEDLPTYFREYAAQSMVVAALENGLAVSYGCETEELPMRLYGGVDEATLSEFVKENDLLRAKHILVEDQATAQMIVEALDDNPSMEQFDALSTVYNTDQGAKSYPDGYLFTKGEMVAEFEAGVRALSINQYGDPVQSDYGWHVILRLDPLGSGELVEMYCSEAFNTLLSSLLETVTITYADVAKNIDVPAFYNKALEYYTSQS